MSLLEAANLSAAISTTVLMITLTVAVLRLASSLLDLLDRPRRRKRRK